MKIDRRNVWKPLFAVCAGGMITPAKPEFRTVERCVLGKWSPIEFAQLRTGDLWRFTDRPDQWRRVTKDPEPCEPEGNFIIESTDEPRPPVLLPGDDTGERS